MNQTTPQTEAPETKQMDLQSLKELHAAVKDGIDTFLAGKIKAVFGGFKTPENGNSWNAFNAFHGDLNAARALHDALLPDHHWEMERDGEVTVSSFIKNKHGNLLVDREFTVQTNDPARSLLLADIEALVAQAEQR